MAIARLLLPKPALCFSSRGFVLSTRRWSSSPSPGDIRNKVSDSEASTNKDTAQKRGPWHSLGSVLTSLKQKIVGNKYLVDKPSGVDYGSTTSARSPEVSAKEYSSGDTAVVTTSDGVSLLKNSDKTKCDSLSMKESSDSRTVSKGVIECVSGIKTSQETEKSISLKAERLGNSSDSSELANMKVLELVSAEKLDLSDEPRSENDSPTYNLINETSESQTLLGDSRGKLPPEKGQIHKEKRHWNKIIDVGQNLESDHKSKPLVISEALNNSSWTFRGEFRSDAILSGDQHNRFGKEIFDSLKLESISKANDKLEFSNERARLTDYFLEGKNHDQMTGDLKIIERKNTHLLETSRNTILPVPGNGKELKVRIESLLDCIKHIPVDSAMGSGRKKPFPDADLQNPKAEKDKTISKGDYVSKGSTSSHGRKEEETTVAPLVKQNQAVSSQVTLASSVNPKKAKKRAYAFSAGKHACETVLVRFLKPNVRKTDIYHALDSSEDILSIQEVASVEGCIYRDAFVTFGTKAAALMALKKTDVLVRSHDVVVEATSLEDAVDRISIPDVIGDPDVPVALVKEPTRTVKIQHLTRDISSNLVKEALAFCGSNISRFFLGSSSSAAFVEFETEDAKERALAVHSISVAGKQLLISRIDVPRTTVLRFSNLSGNMMKGIRPTCMLYGQVKKIVQRSRDVIDVHFMLAEWPNMLNILNSLNGKEMEGRKLVVQPAHVIPPEVLSILMDEPQGKRYVKELIHGLLKKLEPPLNVSHFRNLATELL